MSNFSERQILLWHVIAESKAESIMASLHMFSSISVQCYSLKVFSEKNDSISLILGWKMVDLRNVLKFFMLLFSRNIERY